jgi:hypothetical protein
LPGKSAAEARENFLRPLRRSLSCLTSAQLFVPRVKPGELEALALSADPLLVHSRRLGSDVQFLLGHQFRLVQDGRRLWHVSTTMYRYQLSLPDGTELIAWHWHPVTVGQPHIHAEAGPLGRRLHIPCSRVTVESVIMFLIDELRVRPVAVHAADYAEVLAATERKHIQYRRWNARGPADG